MSGRQELIWPAVSRQELPGGFTIRRYAPLCFTITRTNAPYWCSFDWQRTMVPVAKARNPLAGLHSWKLRVGHLRVGWSR